MHAFAELARSRRDARRLRARRATWLTLNGAYRFAQFGRHLQQHRAVMDPSLVAQLERAGGIRPRSCIGDLHAHPAVPAGARLVRASRLVATPTLARTALPIDHSFFDAVGDRRPSVDTMRRAWYPYRCRSTSPAIRRSVFLWLGKRRAAGGLQLIGRLGADACSCALPRVREAATLGRSNAPSARARLTSICRRRSDHSLPTLRSFDHRLGGGVELEEMGAFRCAATLPRLVDLVQEDAFAVAGRYADVETIAAGSSVRDFWALSSMRA